MSSKRFSWNNIEDVDGRGEGQAEDEQHEQHKVHERHEVKGK